MATTLESPRPPLQPGRDEPLPRKDHQNVGSMERVVSVLAGSALTLYGLRRGSVGGLVLGLLGGAVVKRGVTGHCETYSALGVSTDDVVDTVSGILPERGTVDMSAAATVRAPADELFRMWRDAENLPRFMTFLDGVEVLDDRRARWTISAPLGQTLDFVAEIVEEQEGRLIRWRATEGAMLTHRGEVRFEDAPAGRGTEVRLELHFDPPGGAIGTAVGSLFDGAAELKLRGDLKRFKQLVETGEVATTEGQPAGR